jgi:hypothetical protein
MSRHPNYYKQIINALERLKKSHPKYNMGRHLSTAIDGSDMWGITDKELLFAIQKYEIELNMDVDHVDEEEIEDIIKDGMNLERMFLDEEED